MKQRSSGPGIELTTALRTEASDYGLRVLPLCQSAQQWNILKRVHFILHSSRGQYHIAT
ncbi:hypothetical protein CRENBAI_002351 [Crenichthys baileyi]|uniref:Uncharacterized protein n=1 Tax=Crenichthys baileyi TaxID=28760 RepID=A0AAV9R806_9TELE